MRFAINAVRKGEIASDISVVVSFVLVATDSSFNLEPIFTKFTADLYKTIIMVVRRVQKRRIDLMDIAEEEL